jgi:hypothetical protein
MPKLDRLEVQNFRGVSRPASLIFARKSLLLFGENGTCKSSFVDALEKLFTGKVSTLDGRASGLSSDKHGPHIHSSSTAKTSISVTFDDAAGTVVSTSSQLADLPAGVRGYLDAAKQNLYVLRRRQLLELVESQPRERYDLIRPFLPLEKVEGLEEGLRQAKDQTERHALLARQRLDTRMEDLSRLVGTPLAADTGEELVLAALVPRLLPFGLGSPTSLQALQELGQQLTAALMPFGDMKRHARLTSIQHAAADAQAALAAIDVGRLHSMVSDLRAKEAREASLVYESVLEDGLRWIEEGALRNCPLCEQAITAGSVVQRVRQRLDAVREIVALRRAAVEHRDQMRERAQVAFEAIGRLKQRIFEGDLAYPQSKLLFIDALAEGLEDLHDALTQDIRALTEETLALYAGEFRIGSASGHFAALELHLSQLLAEATPQAHAREMLEAKVLVEKIADIWPLLKENQEDARRRGREAEVALALFEAAAGARKQALQGFFDELSGDINDIFQKLHPDESHGGVRLEIRDAVQKSVSLRADFFDRKSEDPRAYYSEAHLDTLGLSIFLALRRWYRQQRPAFDLLVLDDIMTSVDSVHSVRLSELLLTDFKDYQMFITTHDRIWFEHLWDIQARCGMAQKFVNKVIHKWTLEEGPDLREPEDERAVLDRLIENGSSQEIAGMAGRLLEHTLQEMRYSLRLGIQAKRGEVYEIGEVWPAFYSTVKREYPVLYERGRAHFDALDVRWPLRNWVGAHWNTWARNVSRASAIEFAKAVEGVFDLVFCRGCRRFVSPSGTPLGQLACRCGQTIYPAAGKVPVPPVNRGELVRSTQGALKGARLDTVRLLETRRADRSKEG